MQEPLRKSKKVKRGATLEETDIDGAWLKAHARIARRCRDDKDLGVSRYPYEVAPGLSPFAGGSFEHREGAQSIEIWSDTLACVLFSCTRLNIRTPQGTG
jgi:hypothetical protein